VSFAFNSVWLFLQIYTGNFSSICSFDLKFTVASDLSLDMKHFICDILSFDLLRSSVYDSVLSRCEFVQCGCGMSKVGATFFGRWNGIYYLLGISLVSSAFDLQQMEPFHLIRSIDAFVVPLRGNEKSVVST